MVHGLVRTVREQFPARVSYRWFVPVVRWSVAFRDQAGQPHMTRRRYEWRLKDRTLLLGERTLIMGILNVTPDSFSDGGRYDDPDRAFAHAVALEEAGADLIDIGAERSEEHT